MLGGIGKAAQVCLHELHHVGADRSGSNRVGVPAPVTCLGVEHDRAVRMQAAQEFFGEERVAVRLLIDQLAQRPAALDLGAQSVGNETLDRVGIEWFQDQFHDLVCFAKLVERQDQRMTRVQ